MIPNVSPKTFTLSAVVVGYILIDDLNSTEQNALGNWLMLVAQVLCTNAYYNQLLNERKKPNDKETINMLVSLVNALNKEINDIKEYINNV